MFHSYYRGLTTFSFVGGEVGGGGGEGNVQKKPSKPQLFSTNNKKDIC